MRHVTLRSPAPTARETQLDASTSAKPRTARDAVLLVLAVLFSAIALFVTLDADFLAHPGWLAVQKADFILGPVCIGVYWLRRRPASRFGWLLIILGGVSSLYVLQSFDAPLPFTLGVHAELAIYLVTLALILTFPTGRFDGSVARVLMGLGAIAVAAPAALAYLMSPALSPEGSISGCRAACPENALHIGGDPDLVNGLIDGIRAALILIAAGTAALLVWRIVTGSAPRRRALAIGTPIALVFTGLQIVYQAGMLLDLNGDVLTAVQWAFAGARAALWYGFLLALVAAELFAARVLHRIVLASLDRPTLRELEDMLRGPLGDPRLRLGFWDARTERWADDRGSVLEPPAPGRALAVLELDGQRAVGVDHDAGLADEPELLRAAGAVALLAHENAQLEADWRESLRQLQDSRARVATASAAERRRLERDLHDSVQQRLVALGINLSTARDLAADQSAVHRRLGGLVSELEATMQQLREVSHGTYPATLAEFGLVEALRMGIGNGAPAIELSGTVARHAAEIESAVYFCCLEAVQNATKHAGPNASIEVTLAEDERELRFAVRDDGVGFETSAPYPGDGLRNLHDRLAAVGGWVEVVSAPGRGTTVAGAVQVAARTAARPAD
jgi:signal transduction histidine kinase